LALQPLMAEELVPGNSYDLELPDGSRLNGAIYRGQEAGADSFEVAALVGRIKPRHYRVLHRPKPLPWLVAAAPAYYIPFNQPELSFSGAIGFNLLASIPVFSGTNFFLPRAAVAAGFTRYSGSRALLSGPELTAGPGWVIPFGSEARFYTALTLTAGTAFYELLNTNLNQTFSQTTFLGTAEIGLGIRFSEWGVILSYVQNYLYDKNLPLTSGGVRLGAVYFGGKA
jgi:hypothetical protein